MSVPINRAAVVEWDKLRYLLELVDVVLVDQADENLAELAQLRRLYPNLPAYCRRCGRPCDGGHGQFDGLVWRPLCHDGETPTCFEQGLDTAASRPAGRHLQAVPAPTDTAYANESERP